MLLNKLLESNWFEPTCERSAPALHKLPLSSRTSIMESPDWQMEPGEEAAQQVAMAFRNLAPLLDGSLKLEANPGALKRQRKNGLSEVTANNQQNAQSTATQQTLMLLAKLAIRLDRDMQLLHRETTYLFFFNCKEQDGALHMLLKAAEDWHKQAQSGSSSSTMMPLRQKLFQTLLNETTHRVHLLLQAAETSQMIQTAIKTGILLPDRTFPFMQWDAKAQQLKVTSKTPVSLQKMYDNLLELQDMFADSSLVQRFHSLPSKSQSLVTPWKLQLSTRTDGPFTMLSHLAYSQVWTVVATSLKPHSLHQSPLSTTLETNLGLRPQKGTPGQQKGMGKGKGKGKTKPQIPPPKQEVPES